MNHAIRHTMCLLVAGGLGLSASAKSVDANTAKTVGSNFLISQGVKGVSTYADLSLAYTATGVVNGNTINDYYVFNIAGGKGFVMVAGDDNIIPILGFSNESDFDLTHMSPSTKDWIAGYQNQITAALQYNVAPKAGTAQKWADLESGAYHATARTTTGTPVTPLVATTWDQDGGGTVQYDQYCPNTTMSGGLSVTGCVATAMAQLMKFWNWPTAGCGSHTYTDASGSGATLTADFGNTAYGWSTMPLYSSNAAVATLMYHAGVSVDMSYTYDGSGAYVLSLESYGAPNCAEYALKTYFHYKPSLLGVPRFGEYGGDYEYYGGIFNTNIDSIPESSWVSLLQTELSAGRPMLYMGSGSDGGHCWICDGWETTDDMFHFNWGWSGSSDGYFTVDNLAPPALGVGGGSGNFNTDQGVVMGVMPDSFPNTTGNIKMQAHLNTSTSSPMPYGSPLTITSKVFNSGTSSFTGSFCVLAYDSSGNVVDTIGTLSSETVNAGDSSAVLTFTHSTPLYGMIPVSFHSLRMLYKASSSSAWSFVANNGGYINYTIMDVLDDQDVTLFDSLHIGSHVWPETGAVSVSTTVGNQGTSTWNGTLKAELINVRTGATYVIDSLTGQRIRGNYYYSAVTFSNASMTLPGGTYALLIVDNDGSGTYSTVSSDFYTNPQLISVAYPAGVPAVNAQNDVYVYPNPASNAVNILLQGVSASDITMYDVQGRMVKSITGNTQQLVNIPVGDLAAGTYFVTIQSATGTIVKKIVVAGK